MASLMIKKIISVSVIITFLCTSVFIDSNGFAQGVVTPSSVLPINIHDIQINSEFATLEEKFEVSNEAKQRTVIAIQDAHGIFDAQQNIQRIIQQLQNQYDFEVVGLEGGSGKSDHTFLRAFPNKQINREQAMKYMKRSELSGGEVAAIINTKPGIFYGVEDKNLYFQNRNSFLKALDYRDKNVHVMNLLEKKMNKVRDKIFPENLLSFHKLEQRYLEDQIPLWEFLPILFDRGDKQGLLLEERLPNIIKIYQAMAEARKKPQNKQQQQEVQEELTASIEARKLFEEIEFLRTDVKQELSTESAQKPKQVTELVSLYEWLHRLKALSALEITRNDWDQIKEKFPSQNLSLFTEFLSQFNEHIQLTVDLEPAFDFYRDAIQRDEALLDNLIHAMNTENKDRAILVAGGFHTEGIAQRMREENISYVVYTPRIHEIEEDNNYHAVMRGKVSYKQRTSTIQTILSTMGLEADPESFLWAYTLGGLERVAREAASFAPEALTQEEQKWRNKIIQISKGQSVIKDPSDLLALVEEVIQAAVELSSPEVRDQRMLEQLTQAYLQIFGKDAQTKVTEFAESLKQLMVSLRQEDVRLQPQHLLALLDEDLNVEKTLRELKSEATLDVFSPELVQARSLGRGISEAREEVVFRTRLEKRSAAYFAPGEIQRIYFGPKGEAVYSARVEYLPESKAFKVTFEKEDEVIQEKILAPGDGISYGSSRETDVYLEDEDQRFLSKEHGYISFDHTGSAIRVSQDPRRRTYLIDFDFSYDSSEIQQLISDLIQQSHEKKLSISQENAFKLLNNDQLDLISELEIEVQNMVLARAEVLRILQEIDNIDMLDWEQVEVDYRKLEDAYLLVRPYLNGFQYEKIDSVLTDKAAEVGLFAKHFWASEAGDVFYNYRNKVHPTELQREDIAKGGFGQMMIRALDVKRIFEAAKPYAEKRGAKKPFIVSLGSGAALNEYVMASQQAKVIAIDPDVTTVRQAAEVYGLDEIRTGVFVSKNPDLFDLTLVIGSSKDARDILSEIEGVNIVPFPEEFKRREEALAKDFDILSKQYQRFKALHDAISRIETEIFYAEDDEPEKVPDIQARQANVIGQMAELKELIEKGYEKIKPEYFKLKKEKAEFNEQNPPGVDVVFNAWMPTGIDFRQDLDDIGASLMILVNGGSGSSGIEMKSNESETYLGREYDNSIPNASILKQTTLQGTYASNDAYEQNGWWSADDHGVSEGSFILYTRSSAEAQEKERVEVITYEDEGLGIQDVDPLPWEYEDWWGEYPPRFNQYSKISQVFGDVQRFHGEYQGTSNLVDSRNLVAVMGKSLGGKREDRLVERIRQYRAESVPDRFALRGIVDAIASRGGFEVVSRYMNPDWLDEISRQVHTWEGNIAREPQLQEEVVIVSDVEFRSPDGTKKVDFDSVPGLITVTDTNTGAVNRITDHTDRINSVDFSPDGRLLASGGRDRTVRITDVETGDVVRIIPHDENVNVVQFSSDGTMLLVGEEASQTQVRNQARIWNINDGSLKIEISTLDNDVTDAAFSADSAIAFIVHDPGEISLINMNTGKIISSLLLEDYVEPDFFSVSPNGRTVELIGNNIRNVWYADILPEFVEYEQRLFPNEQFPEKAEAASMGVSKKEDRLVQMIRQYRAESVPNRFDLIQIAKAIAERGGFEVISRYMNPDWLEDIKLQIYSWEDTTRIRSIDFSAEAINVSGTQKLSLDGNKRADYREESGLITITDLSTGEVLNIEAHELGVADVDFSPDGRFLVSASYYDDTVQIREVNTGKLVRTISTEAGTSLVRFSPNGESILVGQVIPSAKLIRVDSGDVIREFWDNVFWNSVTLGGFSPDGSVMFAIDSRGQVLIWNIKSRTGGNFSINEIGQPEFFSVGPDGRTFQVVINNKLKTYYANILQELEEYEQNLFPNEFFPQRVTAESLGSAEGLGRAFLDKDISPEHLERFLVLAYENYNPFGPQPEALPADIETKINNVLASNEINLFAIGEGGFVNEAHLANVQIAMESMIPAMSSIEIARALNRRGVPSQALLSFIQSAYIGYDPFGAGPVPLPSEIQEQIEALLTVAQIDIVIMKNEAILLEAHKILEKLKPPIVYAVSEKEFQEAPLDTNGHVDVAKLLVPDERTIPQGESLRAEIEAYIKAYLGPKEGMDDDVRADYEEKRDWALKNLEKATPGSELLQFMESARRNNILLVISREIDDYEHKFKPYLKALTQIFDEIPVAMTWELIGPVGWEVAKTEATTYGYLSTEDTAVYRPSDEVEGERIAGGAGGGAGMTVMLRKGEDLRDSRVFRNLDMDDSSRFVREEEGVDVYDYNIEKLRETVVHELLGHKRSITKRPVYDVQTEEGKVRVKRKPESEAWELLMGRPAWQAMMRVNKVKKMIPLTDAFREALERNYSIMFNSLMMKYDSLPTDPQELLSMLRNLYQLPHGYYEDVLELVAFTTQFEDLASPTIHPKTKKRDIRNKNHYYNPSREVLKVTNARIGIPIDPENQVYASYTYERRWELLGLDVPYEKHYVQNIRTPEEPVWQTVKWVDGEWVPVGIEVDLIHFDSKRFRKGEVIRLKRFETERLALDIPPPVEDKAGSAPTGSLATLEDLDLLNAEFTLDQLKISLMHLYESTTKDLDELYAPPIREEIKQALDVVGVIRAGTVVDTSAPKSMRLNLIIQILLGQKVEQVDVFKDSEFLFMEEQLLKQFPTQEEVHQQMALVSDLTSSINNLNPNITSVDVRNEIRELEKYYNEVVSREGMSAFNPRQLRLRDFLFNHELDFGNPQELNQQGALYLLQLVAAELSKIPRRKRPRRTFDPNQIRGIGEQKVEARGASLGAVEKLMDQEIPLLELKEEFGDRALLEREKVLQGDVDIKDRWGQLFLLGLRKGAVIEPPSERLTDEDVLLVGKFFFQEVWPRLDTYSRLSHANAVGWLKKINEVRALWYGAISEAGEDSSFGEQIMTGINFFSSDGRHVSANSELGAEVVDFESREALNLIEENRQLTSFSPDGRFVSEGGNFLLGLPTVNNLETGERISFPEEVIVLGEFSPDSRLIQVKLRGKRVGVFNLETDELINFPEEVTGFIKFSSDGRFLEVEFKEKRQGFVHAETGEEIESFYEWPSGVGSIYDISPSFRWLSVQFNKWGIIGGLLGDRLIGVLDLKSGREIQMPQGALSILEFSPNEHWVRVMFERRLGIVELYTGEEIQLPEGIGRVIRFSPDGRRIMAEFMDGRVGVVDLATGEEIQLPEGVTNIVFHPDGRGIIVDSPSGIQWLRFNLKSEYQTPQYEELAQMYPNLVITEGAEAVELLAEEEMVDGLPEGFGRLNNAEKVKEAIRALKEIDFRIQIQGDSRLRSLFGFLDLRTEKDGTQVAVFGDTFLTHRKDGTYLISGERILGISDDYQRILLQLNDEVYEYNRETPEQGLVVAASLGTVQEVRLDQIAQLVGIIDPTTAISKTVTQLAQEALRDLGLSVEEYAVILTDSDSANAAFYTSEGERIIEFNWGLLRFLKKNNILDKDTIKFIVGHEVGHAFVGQKKAEDKEYQPSRLSEEYSADEYGLTAVDKTGGTPIAGMRLMRALRNDKQKLTITTTHPHSHRREVKIYNDIRHNYWTNLYTDSDAIPEEDLDIQRSDRFYFDKALYGELSLDNIRSRIAQAKTYTDILKLINLFNILFRQQTILEELREPTGSGVKIEVTNTFVKNMVSIFDSGDLNLGAKFIQDSGLNPRDYLTESQIEDILRIAEEHAREMDVKFSPERREEFLSLYLGHQLNRIEALLERSPAGYNSDRFSPYSRFVPKTYSESDEYEEYKPTLFGQRMKQDFRTTQNEFLPELTDKIQDLIPELADLSDNDRSQLIQYGFLGGLVYLDDNRVEEGFNLILEGLQWENPTAVFSLMLTNFRRFSNDYLANYFEGDQVPDWVLTLENKEGKIFFHTNDDKPHFVKFVNKLLEDILKGMKANLEEVELDDLFSVYQGVLTYKNVNPKKIDSFKILPYEENLKKIIFRKIERFEDFKRFFLSVEERTEDKFEFDRFTKKRLKIFIRNIETEEELWSALNFLLSQPKLKDQGVAFLKLFASQAIEKMGVSSESLIERFDQLFVEQGLETEWGSEFQKYEPQRNPYLGSFARAYAEIIKNNESLDRKKELIEKYYRKYYHSFDRDLRNSTKTHFAADNRNPLIKLLRETLDTAGVSLEDQLAYFIEQGYLPDETLLSSVPLDDRRAIFDLIISSEDTFLSSKVHKSQYDQMVSILNWNWFFPWEEIPEYTTRTQIEVEIAGGAGVERRTIVDENRPISTLNDFVRQLRPSDSNRTKLNDVIERYDLTHLSDSDFDILFQLMNELVAYEAYLPDLSVSPAGLDDFKDSAHETYQEYSQERGDYLTAWSRLKEDPERNFVISFGDRLFQLWKEQHPGANREEQIAAILKAYPEKSSHRNKVILDLIGEPLRDDPSAFEAVFPHLAESGIRDILAKRILLAKKERGELSLGTYAEVKEVIESSFSKDSDVGQELFNDWLQEADVTLRELQEHKGISATEELARDRKKRTIHSLLERVTDDLETRKPEDKLEVFEWLSGIREEKPKIVEFYEYELKVDLSDLGLLLELGSNSGRYLFLTILFIGPNGILNDESTRKAMVENLYRRGTNEEPSEDNTLFLIFNEMFEASPEFKQLDLVHGIFNHFLKAGDEVGQSRNILIREILTSFGVVGVKLGQVLARMNVIEDEELKRVLEDLSDLVNPLDKRYLLSALLYDHTIEELEQEIDIIGALLGSASIKQGYKIKKTDGSTRALKFIRPLAHYEVNENMDILRRVLIGLRPKIEALEQISEVLLDEIETSVTRELNMPGEIKAQETIGDYSDGEKKKGWRLAVPQVDSSLKGAQFFADDFVGGEPLKEELVAQLRESGEYNKMAQLMFRAIWREILILGRYHADLHPGNIKVDPEKKEVGLLDFGNTGTLSKANQRALIYLMANLQFSRGDAALAAIQEMTSVTALTPELQEALLTIVTERGPPIPEKLKRIKSALDKESIAFQGEFEILFKVLDTVQYVTDELTPSQMRNIFIGVLGAKAYTAVFNPLPEQSPITAASLGEADEEDWQAVEDVPVGRKKTEGAIGVAKSFRDETTPVHQQKWLQRSDRSSINPDWLETNDFIVLIIAVDEIMNGTVYGDQNEINLIFRNALIHREISRELKQNILMYMMGYENLNMKSSRWIWEAGRILEDVDNLEDAAKKLHNEATEVTKKGRPYWKRVWYNFVFASDKLLRFPIELIWKIAELLFPTKTEEIKRTYDPEDSSVESRSLLHVLYFQKIFPQKLGLQEFWTFHIEEADRVQKLIKLGDFILEPENATVFSAKETILDRLFKEISFFPLIGFLSVVLPIILSYSYAPVAITWILPIVFLVAMLLGFRGASTISDDRTSEVMEIGLEEATFFSLVRNRIWDEEDFFIKSGKWFLDQFLSMKNTGQQPLMIDELVSAFVQYSEGRSEGEVQSFYKILGKIRSKLPDTRVSINRHRQRMREVYPFLKGRLDFYTERGLKTDISITAEDTKTPDPEKAPTDISVPPEEPTEKQPRTDRDKVKGASLGGKETSNERGLLNDIEFFINSFRETVMFHLVYGLTKLSWKISDYRMKKSEKIDKSRSPEVIGEKAPTGFVSEERVRKEQLEPGDETKGASLGRTKEDRLVNLIRQYRSEPAQGRTELIQITKLIAKRGGFDAVGRYLRPDWLGEIKKEIYSWEDREMIRSADFTPESLAVTGTEKVTTDGNKRADYGDEPGVINITDLKTGEVLRVEAHTGAVRGIDFSPDGSLLASVGLDNTVRVIDVNTGDIVKTFSKQALNDVVRFSPDGKTILISTGILRSEVELIKADDGTYVREFGHGIYWTSVNLADFSPDSSLIFTIDDLGHVVIWETKTGNSILIFSISGEYAHPEFLSVGPDGRIFQVVINNKLKIYYANILPELEDDEQKLFPNEFFPKREEMAAAASLGGVAAKELSLAPPVAPFNNTELRYLASRLGYGVFEEADEERIREELVLKIRSADVGVLQEQLNEFIQQGSVDVFTQEQKVALESLIQSARLLKPNQLNREVFDLVNRLMDEVEQDLDRSVKVGVRRKLMELFKGVLKGIPPKALAAEIESREAEQVLITQQHERMNQTQEDQEAFQFVVNQLLSQLTSLMEPLKSLNRKVVIVSHANSLPQTKEAVARMLNAAFSEATLDSLGRPKMEWTIYYEEASQVRGIESLLKDLRAERSDIANLIKIKKRDNRAHLERSLENHQSRKKRDESVIFLIPDLSMVRNLREANVMIYSNEEIPEQISFVNEVVAKSLGGLALALELPKESEFRINLMAFARDDLALTITKDSKNQRYVITPNFQQFLTILTQSQAAQKRAARSA